MKRWWLWATIGAALLLISSAQTWVTGTWIDPVLGATRLQVSGTQAGSTLTAGALLAGAALLAGLVGSRPVRLAAAVCLAGGGVLAGLPALRSLTSPTTVVSAAATDLPGSVTLTVRVDDAAATAWPWIGLLAAILVLAGAFLSATDWFRGSTPTGRDRTGEAGARPQPKLDPWDDLTRGHDPTLEP